MTSYRQTFHYCYLMSMWFVHFQTKVYFFSYYECNEVRLLFLMIECWQKSNSSDFLDILYFKDLAQFFFSISQIKNKCCDM
jgi:hypothetical protein